MQIWKFIRILIVIGCLALQGCVIGAAADLAATTVLTAGKLVIKGTGAVIDTAIPDKKDKKEKSKESDD
jgi:hypothetical protein